MKVLIGFLMLMVLNSNSFAGTLTCKASSRNDNSSVLGYDKKMNCFTDDHRFHHVEIYGVGFAPKVSESGIYKINCPFISDYSGTYYGAQSSANIVYGGKVAVMIGDGVCFLGAATIDIGFSIEGVEMTIVERDSEN